MLFPSGIPIKVFTRQSLNIWQHKQKDRCNKYLAPRLQFTDMHMQSSVSQNSVWTHKRHFVCYIHVQPTVLRESPFWRKSRWHSLSKPIIGRHTTFCGMAMFHHCQHWKCWRHGSNRPVQTVTTFISLVWQKVYYCLNCSEVTLNFLDFWNNFFCFVSYMVCISYLYIKHALSNTRLKS
jgi:hypothetical protein